MSESVYLTHDYPISLTHILFRDLDIPLYRGVGDGGLPSDEDEKVLTPTNVEIQLCKLPKIGILDDL